MNRMMMLLTILPALLYSLSSLAFDAPSYFENKCVSCHSIGNGDEVGPDLKGISERRKEEWLIKFIQNSENVINAGDPVGNELFAKFKNKKMPAFELSDDEVKSLLEFIKSGGKGVGDQSFRPATESNAYDYSVGKKLFLGMTKFEKGAPSCVSCHSAGSELSTFGGGTLGPDLVTVSYANYADKGLAKVLKKVSFPTMAEIYGKAPLTDQENFYIRAFLMNENKKFEQNKSKLHQEGNPQNKFALMGVVGASIVLLGMDASWRKRRKKTKKPY